MRSKTGFVYSSMEWKGTTAGMGTLPQMGIYGEAPSVKSARMGSAGFTDILSFQVCSEKQPSATRGRKSLRNRNAALLLFRPQIGKKSSRFCRSLECARRVRRWRAALPSAFQGEGHLEFDLLNTYLAHRIGAVPHVFLSAPEAGATARCHHSGCVDAGWKRV